VTTKPLEIVKDQIGYCGIWCGSCAVGNGALRELTRRFEETTRVYGLKEWVSKDFDYYEFSKGLTSIQHLSFCPGCMKGGGRERCEIRICASKKGLHNCTACDEQVDCKHSMILEKMRSGALAAGLFVKSDQDDRHQLIEKWMAELVSKWPSCILFMNE